ncbi:flagellar biosynthesis regulator FlaF [Yoonia sp. 208BN28-4]|uniref:flagellar biosynthesis regulator FlaF n=1 Tax=Yoonia sp. 208BN28-4 TaxID=3126505 RepID=UPI0030B6382D
MNAIELAQKAYAPTQFPLKSHRAVEAQLIAQITARLRKADANRAENFPQLVAALHDNRQMWLTLAIDLADEDNGLPDTLRAQLFALAQFTHTYTQNVLQNGVSAATLVDINTAILRGLNQSEAG